MPTMKNREELIASLNAKSKREHVSSFAESASERKKDHTPTVAPSAPQDQSGRLTGSFMRVNSAYNKAMGYDK
jgi:hypothetical protein